MDTELGVRRQVWTSQVDLGQVNPFLYATLFSITKGRHCMRVVSEVPSSSKSVRF